MMCQAEEEDYLQRRELGAADGEPQELDFAGRLGKAYVDGYNCANEKELELMYGAKLL